MFINNLDKGLNKLREDNLYRHRRIIDGPQGRCVDISGNSLLNFCSNDYLGLANDPRICESFKAGVDHWGVGSGASHLVCGHSGAHKELEQALAQFTGRPRALLFGSGYAANISAINSLLSRGDHVFQDRLNHASLLDGAWSSRAIFHWFGHQNYADLAQQLTSLPTEGKRLIVSDGTFSMDGDYCDLQSLITTAKAHNACLLLDEAHSFGVLGNGGCGLVDPQKVSTDDVPILVGTLGKAFGTSGAFVAGSEELIETLIQHARHYIFTTAMPSAIAVASLKSLELVQTEQWRRKHLQDLIAYFCASAQSLDLTLLPSRSPIQPIICDSELQALQYSEQLQSRGLLVGAIRPPSVPRGTSRLRITLTANHSRDDIDLLVTALDDITKNTGLNGQ